MSALTVSRPPRRSLGRVLGLTACWILLCLSVLLGIVGGVIVFFAAAAFTAGPPLLFLAALLACLLLTRLLAALPARAIFRERGRRIAWSTALGTTLLLALAATITILPPLARPEPPAQLPRGAAYWDLPTGSHIAYLKVPAVGTPRETPVIRLHGGPGAYEVANTMFTPLYRDLAKEGFDLYLYDQVGSGLSARLPDPRQYTVDRHVADLDAIRQQIGAERIILMGDSWGGYLAAAYMAAHPDRVEKAILTSPAPISEAEWRDKPSQDLPPEQQRKTDEIMTKPRFVAMYVLMQVNPLAAHNFASDAEMDGFFDNWSAGILPAIVCDPSRNPLSEPPHGFGFWSNMMSGSDAVMHDAGRRAQLVTNRTPTLILKGQCDYIKWDVTREYRDTLPNSTLLYFPGAGHAIYLDKPDLYLLAVRAFLLDQPLPLRPYKGASPPSG